MTDLNFVNSNKGKPLLNHDGYLYLQEKEYHPKNGSIKTIYWKCQGYKTWKCGGRVTTRGNTVDIKEPHKEHPAPE